MGDDGTLGGEAFGVFGFFFKVGKGNEEGEVGVLVAGGFETAIKIALDGFPDGKAPRLDHHTSTCFRVFGKISSFNDLLIPFGEVFRAGRCDCRFGLGHNES